MGGREGDVSDCRLWRARRAEGEGQQRCLACSPLLWSLVVVLQGALSQRSAAGCRAEFRDPAVARRSRFRLPLSSDDHPPPCYSAFVLTSIPTHLGLCGLGYLALTLLACVLQQATMSTHSQKRSLSAVVVRPQASFARPSGRSWPSPFRAFRSSARVGDPDAAHAWGLRERTFSLDSHSLP